MITCEECGEEITLGTYYDIEGTIYCKDCMDWFIQGNKRAPGHLRDYWEDVIRDDMEQYRKEL